MPRLLLAVPLILVFASVLIGGHVYIAQRLVLETGFGPAATQALLAVFWLGGASLVLQPIAERTLRPPLSRVVAWPASLWMGVFFLLFVIVAGSDALLWVGGAAAYASGWETGPGDGVARGRALAVVGLAGVAAAFGLRSGLSKPDVKRVEIVLPRWPRSRDGFRIVQISDIHIGPILGRDFASWLAKRVNDLDPDLVAVTGDLVDGSVRKLADEVAPLAELRARHGVWFVTGNHDHYSGARAWVERARELGLRVLRNESVTLGEGDDAFVLAGVDDHRANLMPGEDGEDLDRALADLEPDRAIVLLAHDPSTFKRSSKLGIDLQISGHTHGGQIWPFEYLVRVAIPFVAGLYRRGAAQLYVSRGTGFWGPPMRLFAPAEITEIVLRTGERSPA